MKRLAELHQLGLDIVIPRLLIPLNHIVLTSLVELFHQPSILEPWKHLKVGLNLNHLIESNLIE